MQDELIRLAKKYPNLVVLVSIPAKAAGVEAFAQAFSDRYFTFGLGERNMVSAAAGFALRGKLPVLVGKDLLNKALDQIQKDICLPNLNVKIVNLGKELIPDALKLEKSASLEVLIEGYGPGMLV